MQELAKILDDIEHEHPYHIPGRPETYSEYNDGWTDAIDRVRAELSKKLEELKPYEDTGLTPEQIIKIHGQSIWIPVEDRLPEERINPITNDFYEYQVTAKFGECVDIRHYKFGRGHWWHGTAIVDKYVIAWQPIPEPYNPRKERRP